MILHRNIYFTAFREFEIMYLYLLSILHDWGADDMDQISYKIIHFGDFSDPFGDFYE